MNNRIKSLASAIFCLVTLSVFTSCEEDLADLADKFVGTYATVEKDHFVDMNGRYSDTEIESSITIEKIGGEMVSMTGFAVTSGLVDDNTIQFNNCQTTATDAASGIVRNYNYSFSEATLVGNTLIFTANYTCQEIWPDKSTRNGSGQLKVTAKKVR